MSNERAEEIRGLMEGARAETLGLFEMAREEELRESPGFGFRPVIWHLAHIGVFEAYWLLQKLSGQPAPDERYERIFDPIKTPREESKDLPSRREMEAYLSRVREGVFRVLDRVTFDESDPLLRGAYVFHLVLEHEYQHQETLAYLLHLLAPAAKTRPTAKHARKPEAEAQPTASDHPPSMITIPEGAFEMGAVWDSFAYDNELPPHRVELPVFKIDRLLTTNAEYAHFIEEGGYSRREWWSREGLEWRERELDDAALLVSERRGLACAGDVRRGRGRAHASGHGHQLVRGGSLRALRRQALADRGRVGKGCFLAGEHGSETPLQLGRRRALARAVQFQQPLLGNDERRKLPPWSEPRRVSGHDRQCLGMDGRRLRAVSGLRAVSLPGIFRRLV
ncbi:MAG TPA: DinB family protein [Pyrinomonadaceae bacterium]|nr:DinB family protein [Pyrinomonadaceae bacterium]